MTRLAAIARALRCAEAARPGSSEARAFAAFALMLAHKREPFPITEETLTDDRQEPARRFA